jgi:acylpyruvate hydrolase
MRVATVIVDGHQTWGVVDLVANCLRSALGLGPSLQAFLKQGGTVDALRGLSDATLPLDGVTWAPPIPRPTKIWCVGLNFDDYRRQLGLDYLKAPNIFLKAPSALTGHDSTVGVPSGYGTVFHEWELTAVVARRLHEATAAEAAAATFGYTILHDLTFHELELISRDHQQWAKNVDGFAPCGPWIVTTDELDAKAPLTMRRRRNGRVEAESSTKEMRYQLPELLSFISMFSTLEPGDLVTAGTPPAGPCGAGDVIEGEIEGIGTLRVRLAERPVDPRWQAVLE